MWIIQMLTRNFCQLVPIYQLELFFEIAFTPQANFIYWNHNMTNTGGFFKELNCIAISVWQGQAGWVCAAKELSQFRLPQAQLTQIWLREASVSAVQMEEALMTDIQPS